MKSARISAVTILCAALLCLILGGEGVRAGIEVNTVNGERTFQRLNKIDVENQAMVFDETGPIKWTEMLEAKFSEIEKAPEKGYRIFFRDGSSFIGEITGGRIEGKYLYIKIRSIFTDNKEVEFNAGSLAAVLNLDLQLYRAFALSRKTAEAKAAPFGRIELFGIKMTEKKIKEEFDKDPKKFDAIARELLEEELGDFNARIFDQERWKYDFYFGIDADTRQIFGTINTLDKNLNIEFQPKSGDPIKGNLKNIVGLSFAVDAKPRGYAKRPYVRIRGIGGEIVTGEITASTADKVTLKSDLATTNRNGTPEPVQYEIPIAFIAHIEFYNGSFEFLSNIPKKAITAVEYPDIQGVDSAIPYLFALQHDRTTLPNRLPLTLGKKIYRKGIGCHSYSKITIDIDGDYSRFITLLGIDSQIPESGKTTANVDVTIMCDENIRYTKKGLKFGEIERINIDVKGVKKLTLIVDFGLNSFHHDHVDWANAILLK